MRHLLPLTLIACGPEAPAAPSFQQDVLPILAAQCVRCHGFPAIGGAPPEFRLDSFGDVQVSDGIPNTLCGPPPEPGAELVICGASTYAGAITPRLRDDDRPMPPRFPLDDYQLETLENWSKNPLRGEPRPNNAVPEVSILEVSQAGTIVRVRVVTDDPDGDLVTGTLRANIERDRAVGALRSGTIELAWDVTGIAAGDYSLLAHVDDGAGMHVIPVGTITIAEAP